MIIFEFPTLASKKGHNYENMHPKPLFFLELQTLRVANTILAKNVIFLKKMEQWKLIPLNYAVLGIFYGSNFDRKLEFFRVA